ncbi:MAG: ATP-binding cassette domain-containing protein [Candidatus Levyibacteriota bacterium]
MRAVQDALCLTRVRILTGSGMLIDSLDLTVQPGECATLAGPSGSGKSALLAWIAGALDPGVRARGRVSIGGDDITTLPAERRQVGMLYAEDLLFPHLTVAGNVAFALPRRIRGRDARRSMAERMLDEAGLDGLGGRDPEALAPAQRVRVALLRMLAAEPRALLLDDPFGGLDPELRADLRQFALAQAASRGLPTLLATRAVADARAAGGPALWLSGDGTARAVPTEGRTAEAPRGAPAAPVPGIVQEARPRARRA